MEKIEKQNDIANILVISILFSTVAIIGSTYFFINKQNDKITWDVISKIESIESQKVWGEENYKLLKKLYANKTFAEQQGTQLKGALEQFGESSAAWTGTASSSSSVAAAGADFKKWTLKQEDLDKIMKLAYIKWNKDARVLWLEYSDLECPFCKRHSVQGTVKTIMTKYSDKIKYVFRSYPLPFHEHAQKSSEIMECVWEIGWADKFYEFEEKWFAVDTPDVDTLMGVVKEMWLNEKKVKACLDSGKYTEIIKAQLKEWTDIFNITGTPGNVLVNLDTMEYVIVPWAYPSETFDGIISKWIE